jgi:hypothetical protein
MDTWDGPRYYPVEVVCTAGDRVFVRVLVTDKENFLWVPRAALRDYVQDWDRLVPPPGATAV